MSCVGRFLNRFAPNFIAPKISIIAALPYEQCIERVMRRVGKQTELRDQTYRSIARTIATRQLEEEFSRHLGFQSPPLLRLDPITPIALAEALDWEGHNNYPWENISKWKATDSKGFDVAIWYKNELCGLCYATPRRSRHCIKIILLESKPGRAHPLKGMVGSTALAAIRIYCSLIGCLRIEVQDPAPGAVPLYRQLGFAHDAMGHLVITLEDH